MLISKYRNSKWLTKSDVEAMSLKERQTTVEKISEEEVGDDIKPVLWMKGINKGWPANITALDALSEMAGSEDTDDFAGLKIEIYVDPSVSYAGKRIGGIRLRPAAESDFDDELPRF